MKHLIYTVCIGFVAMSALWGDDGAKSLARFYMIEGNGEKVFTQTVENDLKPLGFSPADPHHRVNDQYEVKYGSTDLDTLSFLPIVQDDTVMELLKKDTRVGIFAPFNMLVYKQKNSATTYLGHLSADAMIEIAGIGDPHAKAQLLRSIKALDETIEKGLKKRGAVFTHKDIPYRNDAKIKTILFSYPIKRDEDFDIDEFIETFQNKFELAFIDKGYLIAGYYNFFETDNGEEILEDTFDAAWSYSLCHLKYSYGVFDGKKGRPDAGLFAPCTMFVAVPKDSDSLYVAMATLANVEHALGIQEPSRVAWMRRLDREIPSILRDFGMTALEPCDILKGLFKPLVDQPPSFEKLPKPKNPTGTKKAKQESASNANNSEKKATQTQKINAGESVIEIIIPEPPAPPKPPKVITKYENAHTLTQEESVVDHTSRKIRFSKRMPPNYVPPKLRNVEKVGESSALPGDVNYGKVSLYLRGNYTQDTPIKEALQKGGFEILARTVLDKKGNLEVFTFTHSDLLEAAQKDNNAFAATLRILHDKKNKKIHLTNPLYLSKAFIHKDFNETKAKQILTQLNDIFKNLKNSEDALKYSALANYRFMKGMPGYNDTVVVATGSDLIEKAKNKKNVAFILPIDEKNTLIGVTFSKRTQGFIKKIGIQNAALLPYMILVKQNEAVILDPKYYIAVMYPDLKMSQFMTIATIPGAIVKECEKVFK